MKKLITLMLSIMMTLTVLNVSFKERVVKAEEPKPQKNSISINVGWDEGCQNLVDLATGHYTLAGIEYEVKDTKGQIYGTFVLDANGVGHNKDTGYSFIDNLPDGMYIIKMSKAVEGIKFESEEKIVTLQSTTDLPTQITVTTQGYMYGRNSSGSTTGWSSEYMLWTTNYGSGVFECGVAEISGPSELNGWGNHTLSTANAKVLPRQGNELIYKIMYYSDHTSGAFWSGFSSIRNVPFVTRDKTNWSSYNGHGLSNARLCAAFIRHVALSRAWGKNAKWNQQTNQDGFTAFWNYVNNTASINNVPENYVVFVWEKYEATKNTSNPQQDMFFATSAGYTYDNQNVSMKVKTEFDPIVIMLTKSGTSGEKVADAEFTLKYYTQDFTNVNEAKNYTAKKSWTFKTGQGGELAYSDEYKVSGDEILIGPEGNAILIPGTYIVSETKVPTNYTKADDFVIRVYADLEKPIEYLTADGTTMLTVDPTAGYALTELKEAYAQVKKTSVYNQSIAGAEYTVFEDANCTVVAKQNNSTEDAVLITKADGTTNTVAIEPNRKYWVKETKAPTGYNLDPTVYEITAGETETIVVESVELLKKATLKVYKEDKEGNRIDDCEFGLFDEQDTLVKSAISNEEGIADFGEIEFGVYYVKETRAKFGYALNPNSFPVVFDENGNYDENGVINMTLTIENDLREYDISLHKVGKETNLPIAGAKYGLFDFATDEQVGELAETDENGIARFENIPYTPTGLYCREVEAPFGYYLNEDIIDVQISNGFDFETHLLERDTNDEERTVHLSIEKVDSETGLPVGGTEFTIYYCANDEVAKVVTTDLETGIATFDLPYAAYYAKETKSAYGYKLCDDIINIEMPTELNEDGSITATKLVVKNDPYRFTLNIHKMNHVKKPLANAKFSVYRLADDVCVASGLVSDENGNVSIELAYSYKGLYVLEDEAPEGYIRSTDPYYLNLEEDGFDIENDILSVYELNVFNQELPVTGDTEFQIALGISVVSLVALTAVIVLRKKYVTSK